MEKLHRIRERFPSQRVSNEEDVSMSWRHRKQTDPSTWEEKVFHKAVLFSDALPSNLLKYVVQE